MAKLLEGKSAVVTGGGRGQGREIALAMARQGVKVVVNDLGGEANGVGSDRAPSDGVVAEIRKAGGTAIANYDSVTDFVAAENIINSCAQNFGGIDILVNCAGIGRMAGQIWETSKEDWDAVIAVNLNGTFNTCRHALALMVEQRAGRIINLSSQAWLGKSGRPSAYGASKGGVVTLTRAIASQMVLEGYGVTCNAIAPQARTRMSPHRVPERWERLYQAGLIDKQHRDESIDPPGPEHIPPFVLYLATDSAANINGRVFGVSRGRVALYSEPVPIKSLYKEGVWTLDELVKRIPTSLALGL